MCKKNHKTTNIAQHSTQSNTPIEKSQFKMKRNLQQCTHKQKRSECVHVCAGKGTLYGYMVWFFCHWEFPFSETGIITHSKWKSTEIYPSTVFRYTFILDTDWTYTQTLYTNRVNWQFIEDWSMWVCVRMCICFCLFRIFYMLFHLSFTGFLSLALSMTLPIHSSLKINADGLNCCNCYFRIYMTFISSFFFATVLSIFPPFQHSWNWNR